ncbi:hypothetical protein RNZ50_06115 [Paracoccaceae bacterium Fryx2]|nr:hypothetical protein [Paracoccaceae bacterium Fryx2]
MPLPGGFTMVPRISARLTGCIALGLALAGPPAVAQERNLTLLGIPSATVAPHGMVYGALSGSDRYLGRFDETDGSLELGFGLGDAQAGIGAQIKVVSTSLTDDFGDSGYFGVKFARQIAAGSMPVFLGLQIDHIAGWGEASDRDPEASLALTAFRLMQFSPGGDSFPMMFTLGVGDNLRNNQTDPGVFFGAGIGLTESLGASAAWSGEGVDIGASFRPQALPAMRVSATVNDVFDQEDSRRVTLSASWALKDVFGR